MSGHPLRVVVGFTGTRAGMTRAQHVRVVQILEWLTTFMAFAPKTIRIVHGDCVGADAEFDAICRRKFFNPECRPSNLAAQRANTPAREAAPPEAPLSRNKKIVRQSDLMIACPAETEEVLRSGTWSTIRAARRLGRPMIVVWPDGSTLKEHLDEFKRIARE